MIVAIIRVAVDSTYDREINIAWLCFWSFVEVDTVIIVSCATSLRQTIKTTQNQSSKLIRTSSLQEYRPFGSNTYTVCCNVKSPKLNEIGVSAVSPLSIVHVQTNIEITSSESGPSDDTERDQIPNFCTEVF
ncbi:hypothetical protein N7532_003346 [Penicillium argentinense]|uniref:Uncharacterized protein n=1 Tax=Penicillium argentinense TaxID=1131581 RepID=A0A9W9FMR0_9EURO|nr:uncharacterized protein N7532_003346 [Penicillium argentinense]KAJ5102817.1 hypothetical protein N7532_003346 [Penicillium argentinense]